MYSGGLDSTGMLYKLLTETDYIIHVHFINNINKENRHNAEKLSCDLCLDWLKINCRPFKYTESVTDFSFLRGSFPWDVDVTNFTAGQILLNSNIQYVAIGQTKTDIERRFSDPIKFKRSQKILDVILETNNSKVEKIFPISNMTKKEIWHYIPDELRKKTWSCRRPKEVNGVFFPCNSCVTCLEINQILNEI